MSEVVLNGPGFAVIQDVQPEGLLTEYSEYFTRTSNEMAPYIMLNDYMIIMHNLHDAYEAGGLDACSEYMTESLMAKMIVINKAHILIDTKLYASTTQINLEAPMMYDFDDLLNVKVISSLVTFRSNRSAPYDQKMYPIVGSSVTDVRVEFYDLVMNNPDTTWIYAISAGMRDTILAIASRQKEWFEEYLKSRESNINFPSISNDNKRILYLTALYHYLVDIFYETIRKDTHYLSMASAYIDLYRSLEREGVDVRDLTLSWVNKEDK